jgi:hypothetical protein
MPAGNDTTLANLELPRIDHSECMFAFIDDRPSLFAACHPFTKVARIFYWKFDQLHSPVQPAGRRGNAENGNCALLRRREIRIPHDLPKVVIRVLKVARVTTPECVLR